MSPTARSDSWSEATIDALGWLRPLLWAAMAFTLWFALIAPARADLFPFPPPGTGCPPNTSCIPGGNPGGGNPGQCTPNPNGNPGCNGAGNPVDIITGNKYQHEIDLAPLPGELGVHFARHYNSNSTHRGLTGVGWRSSYEIVLVDLGSALQIIDADGRRLTFARHADQPSLCVSARPEDGRVIVDENKDAGANKAKAVSYRWQRLDGSEYAFSGGSGDGHPLQSIRAASGATSTLTYLGGALDSVRDPQGRTLRFIYAKPLAAGSTRHRMLALSAIETPVGRISYKLDDNGRLQTVTQPNGLVHRYHYESERQGTAANIWALTGISVEWPQDGQTITQRLATYTYDAQSRAVRTQHVGGDDISLSYGPRAQTVISLNEGANPGARTVYRHALVAGQWKTVEAIGPGCATCPPANVRYRYRIDGSMAGTLEATLRLDEQGKPLQQERVQSDAAGRPLRVEQIGYVAGKAQPAQIALRAEYTAMPQDALTSQMSAPQFAALWRPKLVARPSVMAGLEHAIAITYNAHLQPVTMTEAGASPIDADGNFKPTAFARTTSYSYAQIAGASRLIAVDGPLPGSADTIKYHYDDQGRLRLVQHPVADLQERFAYDEAGRVVWRMPTDAVPVRTAFDVSGEPSSWQRGEARVTVVRDARGRPVRIEMPDGEIRWLGHDGPGGLGAEMSNRGRGHWRVPTLEAAQFLAQKRAAATASNVYAAENAAVSIAHAQDVPASSWGATNVYRDDFGRLVALRTQVTGVEVRRYDETNRLLERRFADGGVWRYERDAAGRVIAHTVMAPTAPTATTRVQWFGAYPVRIEHPNETESRRFDVSGRLAERSIERASGLRFTERFAYDVADRLTTHELPEGGALHYAWGIGAQLRAIDYESSLGQTQSLIAPLQESGAAPVSSGSTTTKTALQVSSSAFSGSAAGGYRYGNGIEARWQLDAAGQLARLQHVSTPSAGKHASWWNVLLAWIPTAWAADDAVPIAGWRYDYDAAGRMATRSDVVNHAANAFGYDRRARLVVSEPLSIAMPESSSQPSTVPATREYYAYDTLGNTLGRRVDNSDEDFRKLVIERNVAGLPQRIGNRTLNYSADRRLTAVQEGGRLLASYRHNTYGERVGKRAPDFGEVDYLYARQQLAAETVPNHLNLLARRYVYAHGVPVVVIDYPRGQSLRSKARRDAGYFARIASHAQTVVNHAAGRAPHVSYVHANEIGTPVAMTDRAQRVQWRAEYRLYGEANVTVAPASVTSSPTGLALNLRLPGHYWDVDTGWHDNYLRTYDPARGQYLEPDPLGPTALGAAPATQPFSYANHNPLIYADPLGLILFAFDGTGNDESNLRTLSNVVHFRNLYRSDNSRVNYITGPGTLDPGSGISPPAGDAGFSFSGLDRVAYMVRYLNAEANRDDDNTPMDIDIIGFSRGAAQAREFANRIVSNTRNGWYSYRDAVTGQLNCQRVNFRFMGLWDSVLSTHTGSYNLSVPDAFGYVSQAVALNEYRGQTLRQLPLPPGAFPLESIQGRPAPAGTSRIERGFLGSHSDIGGGFEQGDLARVALVWMIEQARAAGVQMANGPATIAAAPALHDKSNSLLRSPGRPTPQIEDRQVRFADGRTTTQRAMTGTTMTYSDTERYISYLPDRGRGDYVTGTVDMRGYLQWLNANGYGINLTVP